MMCVHQYYAAKLRELMDSIEHWSLATAEQRARANFFTSMMRLAVEESTSE